MNLQYIHDNNGKATGVFMPIEQWQTLKTKYVDLQIEESQNDYDLLDWQKNILDNRLDDYYNNPTNVVDFDITIANIRKTL